LRRACVDASRRGVVSTMARWSGTSAIQASQPKLKSGKQSGERRPARPARLNWRAEAAVIPVDMPNFN